MRIYYTGTDNGDGSIGVRFFDSIECIDKLEEYEGFRGEGGGSFEVEGIITGIEIETMAEVDKYLEDMGLLND